MVYNSSGWTPVALRNRAAPSSLRPSIRCSAGTTMRSDTTCIYQTSRYRGMLPMSSHDRPFGKQLSEGADGSVEAGRYKSLLLQHKSNFPTRGRPTRHQEITKDPNRLKEADERASSSGAIRACASNEHYLYSRKTTILVSVYS